MYPQTGNDYEMHEQSKASFNHDIAVDDPLTAVTEH